MRGVDQIRVHKEGSLEDTLGEQFGRMHPPATHMHHTLPEAPEHRNLLAWVCEVLPQGPCFLKLPVVMPRKEWSLKHSLGSSGPYAPWGAELREALWGRI